jgi:excisionase family DNA binding protein
MEKATLSVKEAAAVVGVSLPVMYELTERKDFSCLLRIGRKKLILREGLLKWMENSATAAKQ